ncbi:MAG TPA: PilZ domain-containing protein [Nitrospirota bacterium]|nr:PilZ domain-containing protein [Nitrospirota bacterium]
MAVYGIGMNNKRSKGRARREINVEIRSPKEVKQAYSLDFSSGGVKVGAAMLRLPLGESVEFVMEKNGSKVSFPGRVVREDGLERINRIGREANTFFIKISEERFAEFVRGNFSV